MPPWLGAITLRANCTLIAQKINNGPAAIKAQARDSYPDLGFHHGGG